VSELVVLAVFMWLVTYPSRAVAFLAPGIERLPRPILDYLQLVGPAILTALAIVNVAVVLDAANRPVFHVGLEWLAVAACAAITIRLRNLLFGLVAAIAIMTVARLAGLV
jgi:branched-subunit amino acid transport protein